MAHDYEFYMQAVDIDGTPLPKAPIKDLENDFEGLKYSKSVGLNKIGKNTVYTEKYADSEKLRVYLPENQISSPTDVKLTLYFVGDERYDTYNEFNEYILKGFHKYWDTARNREFVFFIEDEITPEEECWEGSYPYIKVTYTLKNVKGYTKLKP